MFYSASNDGTHIISTGGSSPALLINSSLTEKVDNIPDVYAKLPKTQVSCLLGTIKLKYHKYIVLADKHTVTGSILGHQIAKIDSFKLIPILTGGPSSSATSDSEEKHYLDLLNSHLSNATLYFSVDNTFDLTRRLQDQYGATAAGGAPVGPDPKFWWNHYLSAELSSNADFAQFFSPVIYGYFKSSTIQAPDHRSFEFALLTRRSVNRAGTRYFRRGIDTDGHVANFNETEQILTTSNNQNQSNQIFSFLQIRGSVPIYWAEINNLKYKPNLVISSKTSLEPTTAHFQESVEKYGETYCVNLVNQSGYEKPVKEGFESILSNIESSNPELSSKIHYIYFDFHHECRKMRWDRVDLLLKSLIDLQYTSDNYFQYDLTTKQIVSVQTKVVRTNCMDCLDRTNVVQSTLGRWILQNQLTRSQYLVENNVTPWKVVIPSLLPVFQNFWADNADSVSCSYSGTGALKTDFTRTGQRTKQGAFNDLVNSITRYYKNNYNDGNRQDGYDLFLGKYKPFQDSINSPFIDRRPAYVQLLPYLMGTSILVLFAILIFPRGSITDLNNSLAIGVSLLSTIRSLMYLNKHGYQFVNWPKLEKLDYLKKVDAFDGEGKSVGIKYEENDNFRSVHTKGE
ncbi:phosphatidylinositol-3-phosphatase Sac1p [[Candida] railenensis]|uniref:Phosphatidylinositol-3-phosphatase Sac1p n=1 Tax=[Candida] railenensis TaxID=45579 RepID=A0A9P0QLT9_9ASCO|nr:phosphatidylinositol-3-phosphatase Sac1p [[Candida] railenensis]